MFRRSVSNEPGSRTSRKLSNVTENKEEDESAQTFQVLLEKKGRARGTIGLFSGRPWAIRTFKLKKQVLGYYDGDELRGEIAIAGAKCIKLDSRDADQKSCPFEIQCVNNEHVVLNASCEDVRRHCIEVFTLAANDPNWTMPDGVIATASSSRQVQKQIEDDTANHTLWFYEAVNDSSVDEVRELYEQYKDSIQVDFLSPDDGQTPLTSACYRNNLDIAKFLLEECHALVNRPNYYGITALMLAVNFNRSKLADYLINYPDCDVDLEDQNGESAYFLAVDEEIKELILKKTKCPEKYLLRQNKMATEESANELSHPLEMAGVVSTIQAKIPHDATKSQLSSDPTTAPVVFHGGAPREWPSPPEDHSISAPSDQPVERISQEVKRPRQVLIEGIPKAIFLSYVHFAVKNSEKKLNEAMKARNLPLAKQYSQQRDEAKKKLVDFGNDVIVSKEFLEFTDVMEQKQWLENQVQSYIDSLWSTEDLEEMEKFDAIEQATHFMEKYLCGDSGGGVVEKKQESKQDFDTLWIQTSIMSLTNNEDGSIFVSDATFSPKDMNINARVPVNVKLSLALGLSRLENEHHLLCSLFAQSSKVVIKPLGLLTTDSEILSTISNSVSSAPDAEEALSNDRTSLLSKGCLRSTVSEDESAALQSYVALVTAKHDETLKNYFQSRPATAIRYGERLMIVESIVDIVLVAHNCGFCLLQDLTPANIVKSTQSADFVLGSLCHTVRFGQSLTISSGERKDISYWSYEMAQQCVQQEESVLLSKSSMDLCALGWIIWQVMGGVSLWEQRGIDCSVPDNVIQCLTKITDQEIQQAIATAFPQENKSSLRRLLSDLLATDPNKRCDLSTVYDDYAFFGRRDVDSAEELANALERQNSLRLAAEVEAAEAERRKNLHVQQTEASKACLSILIQSFESNNQISSSTIQQLVASVKATPSIPAALVQLISPVLHHFSKQKPSTQCNCQTISRTLSSILKFQVEDIVQLPAYVQKVRNELKSRGNCFPYLFCMLPVVNYTPAAVTANGARSTGGSLIQQFKHLYWNRAKLVFICPVTLRVMQSGRSREGYQIDPPEQWIIETAPLLKLGVLFLKLALLAQDLNQMPQHFQIPIDDLDAVVEMLNAIKPNDSIVSNNAEFSTAIMTLFELIGREEGVDVHKLFSTWRLQRTGLSFTTCAKPRKTTSAWVSEDGRSHFEENGEEAFVV